MKVIKIYTDGGYRRKSKIGAYSYVTLIDDIIDKKESMAVPEINGLKVTNNTMELQAVIKSLSQLNWYMSNGYKTNNCIVYLWTDSQYVQLGLTEWIHNWKRNGWKNASNKPIHNKKLWIELNELFEKLNKFYKSINIQWVEGHSGDKWNDEVDKMCNNAMDNYIINIENE